MPGPLFAVDAPFVLYRSFYALPDSIHGSVGRPVNALLGATNLLLRIAADRSPRAIVMCFGAEAAPYRTELFPSYHADRPPVPEALAWQFERAPELFSAFGWAIESSPELEADDLLGSLAGVESDAGGQALIVTGDRDMFQCVGDRVSVLRLGVQAPVVTAARLHRAARRPVRRVARRAGNRPQDRGHPARQVRLARGGDRRRRRRAPEGGSGVDGIRRRAARVPGHRHTAHGFGEAAPGSSDRSGERCARGAGALVDG